MGRVSKTAWGMEGKEVAPAALAFAGAKSTNHAWKIARARRSSVRAVRRVLLYLVVKRAEDTGDSALFVRFGHNHLTWIHRRTRG